MMEEQAGSRNIAGNHLSVSGQVLRIGRMEEQRKEPIIVTIHRTTCLEEPNSTPHYSEMV